MADQQIQDKIAPGKRVDLGEGIALVVKSDNGGLFGGTIRSDLVLTGMPHPIPLQTRYSTGWIPGEGLARLRTTLVPSGAFWKQITTSGVRWQDARHPVSMATVVSWNGAQQTRVQVSGGSYRTASEETRWGDLTLLAHLDGMDHRSFIVREPDLRWSSIRNPHDAVRLHDVQYENRIVVQKGILSAASRIHLGASTIYGTDVQGLSLRSHFSGLPYDRILAISRNAHLSNAQKQQEIAVAVLESPLRYQLQRLVFTADHGAQLRAQAQIAYPGGNVGTVSNPLALLSLWTRVSGQAQMRLNPAMVDAVERWYLSDLAHIRNPQTLAQIQPVLLDRLQKAGLLRPQKGDYAIDLAVDHGSATINGIPLPQASQAILMAFLEATHGLS